jgi:hypothetical protein
MVLVFRPAFIVKTAGEGAAAQGSNAAMRAVPEA